MSLLGLSKVTSSKKEDNITHLTFGKMHLYLEHFDTHITNELFDLVITGNAIIDDYSLQDVEKTLEQAEGTFAYCLWLKKESRIVIGTDCLGFFPLFYIETETGVNFSNFLFHLKPFLNSPKPCWDAWDEILNETDILGDKTTISGVKRLRQGQKIVVEYHKPSIVDFWQFRSPEFVGLEQYLEQNNYYMFESMKTLSGKNMVIPSTGGHDSRRIVLMAHKLQQQFSTITQEAEFKDGYDVDSFVAKMVANTLGISEHTQLSAINKSLFDLDTRYKDIWNGFESPNHAWAVNLLRYLPNYSSVYDGIVGDISINNGFTTNFSLFKKNYHDLDFLINEHTANKRLFKLKASKLENDNYTRVRQELERFDNDPNRYNLFKIFNHTRRNIAHWYSPFILHGHQVKLPYCYTPLFKQSFSLNINEREYTTAHLEAMSKIDKEISNLPSTRTHLDMSYWAKLSVPKVKCEKSPVNLKNSPLPQKVFKNFETTFKDIILDQMVFAVIPDKVLSKKPWRYEPLQRLYHFLTWLETDHSKLPILHKETPASNGF